MSEPRMQDLVEAAAPLLRAPWAVVHDPQATPLDIFLCFRLLLGRTPGEHEWFGHVGRAGEALAEVVKVYVNSLEFSARKLLGTSALGHLQQFDGDGFSLLVPADDLSVGKPILTQGDYEPHVSRQFRRLLRPGMAVLDVGANVGWFSMLAASLVGPSGHVLAVEPSGDNAKIVEASRRLNRFAHVTVLQAAAGNATGMLCYFNVGTNCVTANVPEDVQQLLAAQTSACVRLDDVYPRACGLDLVKIDIEGSEPMALAGAERLLATHRPAILSEFNPGGLESIGRCAPRDYLRQLIGYGYELAVVRHDADPAPCGTDVDAVMAAYDACGITHLDLLATPR